MTAAAIIGTGNLAWHLAHLLPSPTIVVSRARGNSERWPCPVVSYDELCPVSPEVVFLAVPDAVIPTVTTRLADLLPAATAVVHTSGATPLSAITDTFVNRGVLWPIRSLRHGEAVADWRDVPLVIQASNSTTRKLLTRTAKSLSDTVSYLDDRQRAQLHLAAVFSNNFVTALYEVAHRLCSDYGVPFDLLLPIIRHTATRQTAAPPRLQQTGAATRGDTATMQRHLDLIERPEYAELYRKLSNLIFQNRLPQYDADFGRKPDDDLQNQRIT